MFSWHDEHFSVHWFGLAVLAHRITPIARIEEILNPCNPRNPRSKAKARGKAASHNPRSIRVVRATARLLDCGSAALGL
jgi:hypothetical protein